MNPCYPGRLFEFSPIQLDSTRMTVNQKRPKTQGEPSKSKVFDHFRSIGLITADIPFAVQSRGGVCFLTASIGKTFHIYNTESLGLLFVGPSLDGRIDGLASHEEDTFVGTETGSLYRVERATIKEKISLGTEKVLSLQVLGDNLLVLSKDSLLVYTLNLKKLVGKIDFSSQEATCFLHPHTYLNKVLVAFKSGSLQLWNFRTGKLIHDFTRSPDATPAGAVTCMAQAPVLDIAAVGHEDGRVSLLDLRKDELLFTLKACKTSATSISFRSDAASENKPQMAVGSADGMIAVWNLESRNLEHTIDAHEKGISSVFFLPGQPIMVSAGRDNALKEWIFEFEECRLLKSRTGHLAPPSLVRFVGSDGFSVLSAGADQSLRMNSILKDAQSHELSQGQIEKKARRLQLKASQLKLAPIIAIDFFTAKDLKWDNLISAHHGSSSARTWRIDHKSVGKYVFKASSDLVSAVAMSPCGNYGLTGDVRGAVQVYNMQSGQHRRTFQCAGSVLGLAVDQFAKELLVLTKEGGVAVFDFNKPSKVLHSEQLPSGAQAFSFKADNGLAAIALDSHQIHVYDLEARRTVRRLAGHSQRVNDMTFSSDGKWLVSCSQDRSIRTWDLPSGLLLDSLVSGETPVSVSLSPAGDFLVSVHEGDLSLHLWYNKSILSPLRLDLSTWSIPEMAQDNLQRNLVQLSSQPRSKWLSIFHLDTIKAMNKPVMPEEAPKKAPFFLDASLIKRTIDGEPAHSEDADEKRTGGLRLESLLLISHDGPLMEYLAEAGASLVQLEILSLPEDNISLHLSFLSFILAQIRTRSNYDLVQTYLNVYLRCHRDFVSEHRGDFLGVLGQLEAAQEETWGGLEALIQQSLCLTAFCRDRY